jgi:hypothetical protein
VFFKKQRGKPSPDFKQMSRHLFILQRWRSTDVPIKTQLRRHLVRNVTTVSEPKSVVNGNHTKNTAVALEPL